MGAWLETACIAVFLFFFLHIKTIRFYMASVPNPVLKAYACFFFIFCAGHCLGLPRTTFPFVSWDMFSQGANFGPVVPFFRYEATTLSGRKFLIMPEIYYPSLANGRIVTYLDNLTGSIISYNPAQENYFFKRQQQLIDGYTAKQGAIGHFIAGLRLATDEEKLFTLDEKKKHLNEVLQAIARRYDTMYPEDRLKSIDIIKGTIDMAQGPQVQPAFRRVWHLSIGGNG